MQPLTTSGSSFAAGAGLAAGVTIATCGGRAL
jgi:hypothetical protein